MNLNIEAKNFVSQLVLQILYKSLDFIFIWLANVSDTLLTLPPVYCKTHAKPKPKFGMGLLYSAPPLLLLPLLSLARKPFTDSASQKLT